MIFDKDKLIEYVKELHEGALKMIYYMNNENLKPYWQGRIDFINKLLKAIDEINTRDDLVNFLRHNNIKRRFYKFENNEEMRYIRGELEVIKEVYEKIKI